MITKFKLKNCILLCKNCHNKLHYSINSNVDKKDKKIFLEYKGVNGCIICGYNECVASLEFHHKDPKDKLFLISNKSHYYKSIESLKIEIEKEINKCDVLCSNCHAESHLNDGFYASHEEEIIKKSKNMIEKMMKIDRDIILYLFKNGYRQIDISNELGIKRGIVSSIFKELGLPKKTIEH